MARRGKEEIVEIDASDEVDPAKLSKLLIKEFNKEEEKTGKIAWNLATDLDNPTDVKEWISTQSTLLDLIVSNRKDGGIPVGKLTEISGEEASGKSLLCAHLIAEAQKKGGIAIYIDTENAAHPGFMQQVGVDISKMVYLQPGTIEEVGETIEKTILMTRAKAANKLVLIIWDSVAGTPSQAEIEGNYDPNDRIGVTAKALAKMMRKLTQVWGKERIAMVFTNQLKTKIGVVYGDPMTTPGGKAIPYHASVRIRLERGQTQKDGENEVYGVHTRAKTVKNRLGPPLRKCEFDILFSTGIDDESSWFGKLHEMGEIVKDGGWCYVPSIPSGRLEEKGVHEGKDRGIKFREKDFSGMAKDDPDFRKHVLGLLEKHMIVRYGEKPKDFSADSESLMDNEAVTELVMAEA